MGIFSWLFGRKKEQTSPRPSYTVSSVRPSAAAQRWSAPAAQPPRVHSATAIAQQKRDEEARHRREDEDRRYHDDSILNNPIGTFAAMSIISDLTRDDTPEPVHHYSAPEPSPAPTYDPPASTYEAPTSQPSYDPPSSDSSSGSYSGGDSGGSSGD